MNENKQQLKLHKRITVKNVFGSVSNYVKRLEEGFSEEIMLVAGTVTDYENVQAKSGEFKDSTRFLGDFSAKKIGDDVINSAHELFLPSIAESFLLSGLLSASGREDFVGLDFAFKIGVEFDTSVIGFRYTVVPMMEVFGKLETKSIKLLELF